jgi:hypothetical protein
MLTNAIVGGTPAYRGEFAQDGVPAGPGEFDQRLCCTVVINPGRPLLREARYSAPRPENRIHRSMEKNPRSAVLRMPSVND